jgi:citrate lyase subunit beta/citryl-CoA lyase
MLPKAETVEQVTMMTTRLATSNSIILLIESAKGLGHLSGLLQTPGVARIAFGSVDFSLDIGAEHNRTALLAARSELVWRSRAAGLPAPLDGVTTNLSDPAQAQDDAHHAAMLGFGGKMAIHPNQVAPIFTGFQPDKDAITWAHKIVMVGSNAATLVGGEMVDRPVLERARRILDRVRTP